METLNSHRLKMREERARRTSFVSRRMRTTRSAKMSSVPPTTPKSKIEVKIENTSTQNHDESK